MTAAVAIAGASAPDSRKIVVGEPMWLGSTVLAALASLTLCYPAWPGHFGYDALHAYETSMTGIQNMVWPPMHAYLFWLSRKIGGGPGLLFAVQTFILFFSGLLAASLLVRRRLLALAAGLGFLGLFILVPPMLGVAMSQWRDVPTGSFALLAFALWLLASRYRSWPIFAAAGAALGVSVSLRYNAFPLFALTAPLMVVLPFLGRTGGWRPRIRAALIVAMCVGAAVASTQWRLPDFKRVPAANTQFLIQLFDLLGVSACSDQSFVPAQFTGGALTGAQVRELYDPRHAQMAYGPHPGVPQLDLSAPNSAELIDQAWRAAIPQHLGCYFAHRNIVLVEQLGLEKRRVFYPAHGNVDPNPFGIRLEHPALSAAVTGYVVKTSSELWRRPVWLYVLGLLLGGGLALRRDPRAIVCLALVGGAFANVALLYVIGPAADARYIFPSNVQCALAIAIALASLFDPPAGSKPRAAGSRQAVPDDAAPPRRALAGR